MVRIEFETENAAFGDDDKEARHAEIARILRKLAQIVERGIAVDGALFDVNGNRVGRFDLKAANKKAASS